MLALNYAPSGGTSMMYAVAAFGSAALLLAFAPAAGAADLPAPIAVAVADSHRPPEDVAADALRKPAALMAFAGAKPGETIVDYIPGTGYFTRIFSKIAGAGGHVFAVLPNEYAKVDPESVMALDALSAEPAYANVSVIRQPAASFAVPAPADLIWTSQNYHDLHDKFMGSPDVAAIDKALFAALKPGGVLVVEDHVAEAGSGLRDTDTLHRIDPATIKSELAGAGFVFDGESTILRNPADNHTLKVFDKSIRGHTDQVVYRFSKPRTAR
jgi:predicted methyltransferase